MVCFFGCWCVVVVVSEGVGVFGPPCATRCAVCDVRAVCGEAGGGAGSADEVPGGRGADVGGRGAWVGWDGMGWGGMRWGRMGWDGM